MDDQQDVEMPTPQPIDNSLEERVRLAPMYPAPTSELPGKNVNLLFSQNDKNKCQLFPEKYNNEIIRKILYNLC